LIIDQKEKINNFFRNLRKIDQNMTDVFLNEKKGLYYRSETSLKKIEVKKEYLKMIFNSFFFQLNLQEREIYRNKKSLDTSYSLDDSRYRMTFYKEYSSNAIAIRILEQEPWSFKEIGLEKNVTDSILSYNSGLILISGSTSAGKSTTMNSIINSISINNNYHIMTIEDPIEFIYKNDNSYFSQREIGLNVDSYAQAIKDAMRSNPDVIALGEIRDRETAIEALKASQTGHLVISTIHADSIINTIERFIGLFEDENKHIAKSDLSSTLKLIINQKIIPTITNKPLMIYENIYGTMDVLNKIKEDTKQLIQLRNIMETQGILTIDKKLVNLYEKKKITYSTLLANKTSHLKI